MSLEPAGVKLVAENASGFESALASAGKAVTGFAGLVAGAAVGIGVGIAGGLGAAAAAGLGFNKSLEDASARIQSFTKDSAETAKILEMVEDRAAKTPFAFEEMAAAAAGLGPAAKAAGVPLEELIGTAEILAASNPAEGLEGAAFAIREAASGDFTLAIERFNLSRQTINQLKEEGVPALEILSRAMQEAGYDADLVANLANTAGGRLSTFKDTFVSLAGTVTKPIFTAFSEALGRVNEQLAAAGPTLEAAATTLGEKLAPHAAAAADMAVRFAGAIIETISALADAGPMSSEFAEAAGLIHPALQPIILTLQDLARGDFGAVFGRISEAMTAWAEEATPQIVAGLQAMGQAFVTWAAEQAMRFGAWVVEATPGLIANLQVAGQQLLAWVQEQAPTWAAQLAALGSQLGQWVLDALPGLLTALADARLALVSWVLDSLPGWAAELDKLRTAMIDWVAASLPDLGTNLGKIAALLLAKTGEFIAVVAPKLLELAGQFVTWVATEALPRLPGELAKIGTAIVVGVVNFIKEVSPEIVKLANQFVNWVQEEVLPNLPGKMAEIGTAILTGIGDFLENVITEAKKVGKAIIDGIADGISGAAGIVAQAARDAAAAAFEAAKKFLGIASPSKLFMSLGLNVGDSFAGGILKAIPAAAQAATELAEETRDKVMKELERIAKDVQSFMAERLTGRIGLARAGIGGLDVLKDAQRELFDLQKAQVEAGNAIAAHQEEQAARRLENEEAAREVAREVAALEEEKRDAMLTAEQNIDPEARAEAAERVREIEAEIAAVLAASDEARRQAIADEAAAQAELVELEKERAEIARQIMVAAERERYIREETMKAQAAAAEIAKTDPVFARDFLARRQAQIGELADLRAELTQESNVDTRAIIEEQIRLLEAAMALELEQLQQTGAERAERIRALGNPQELGDEAGDAFLAGLRDSLMQGQKDIADIIGETFVNALQAAFAGLTVGLAPPPSAGLVSGPPPAPGASANSYATYGDQNVTISGANLTMSQLESMVRRVLSDQARAASQIARGA